MEAGDWTGPGGAPQHPRPQRRRGGRPRDGARRDPAARRRLRVERRERDHERQLGPPRPPGHPHAARAGRGQGGHRPDDEARRLGRAQRRRPASSPAIARRVRGACRLLLARRGAPAGGPATPPRAAAGAPTSSSADVLVEREGGRSNADRRPSRRSRSRSAALRATTSPTRSPPPAARGRWARRSRRSRDGLRDFRPSVERSPGPAEHLPRGQPGRDRRLRAQRGRPRGGPRRGRGDRRRAARAGRRRSRRSSARPGTARTTRCAASAGSPAQRAQRVVDQGDAALPARPDARIVVGELLAGIASARASRRATSRLPVETAALRAELAGGDAVVPPARARTPRVSSLDVPRGAGRGVPTSSRSSGRGRSTWRAS